ncbi:MAG: TatD family nuclease-associated radical SAM protein [Elusimicrobiota bacterium]
MEIAYEVKNGLYLNITNRCPNSCTFCMKFKGHMNYMKYNLKLLKEPDYDPIKKDIEDHFSRKKYDEIVFCGYGEPTMRFDLIKDVAKSIREGKFNNVPVNIRIRINTNGLGNLINKRDITTEMKGLIDALHISVNTVNPKQWIEIMRPLKEFKENGFAAVIDFVKSAKDNVNEVVVTAVDLKEVDIQAVMRFARSLGVNFRLRPFIEL